MHEGADEDFDADDEEHDCDHDHDVFLGGGCLFKDGFPAQTSTTQEVSYMGRTIMGWLGYQEAGRPLNIQECKVSTLANYQIGKL